MCFVIFVTNFEQPSCKSGPNLYISNFVKNILFNSMMQISNLSNFLVFYNFFDY